MIASYQAFRSLFFTISVLVVALSSCSCGAAKYSTSVQNAINSEDKTEVDVATKSVGVADTNRPIINEVTAKELLKGKSRVIVKKRFVEDAAYAGQPVLSQEEFNKFNVVYVIKHDFNLMGSNITIPQDCALAFEGGSFKNGCIIGNETPIVYSGTIFNDVCVKGTWVVPIIHSSMFADIKMHCNRLKDVVGLTNPYVENTVYIEEGNYNLEVEKVTEHLLPLNSHTSVVLDGIISVMGNSFPRYRIFSIFDACDVNIKGTGKIVGDRDLHTYILDAPEPESKRGANTTHEYGHGIQITNASNVDISGITITKCIGDGICIDGNDVSCWGLTVSYCRRQGISVVGGERISISDCNISHTWGSRKAGFGIDIEPDSEHSVSDVTITNCDISYCNGGINTQCHSFESVKRVKINNCCLSTFAQDNIKEEGREQYRAVMCFGANDVEWNKCSIEDSNTLVYVEDAVDFTMRECNLVSRGSRYGIILRESRGTVTLHKNNISMYERDSNNPQGIAIANLNNAIVTDNEIVSDEFSASGDTDIQNVVLRGNIINARWETGREVRGSTIENNIFKKKVVLDKVKESTLKDNQMYSLKVKSKDRSEIVSNITEK